jgi:hypothetical protein
MYVMITARRPILEEAVWLETPVLQRLEPTAMHQPPKLFQTEAPHSPHQHSTRDAMAPTLEEALFKVRPKPRHWHGVAARSHRPRARAPARARGAHPGMRGGDARSAVIDVMGF